MYCSNCGTKIAKESKFCFSCGAEQTSDLAAKVAKKPSKQTKTAAPKLNQIDFGKKAVANSKQLLENVRSFLAKHKVKSLIGAALVVAIIGTLTYPGVLSPLNATQFPKLKQALSDATISKSVNVLCDPLVQLLPTPEDYAGFAKLESQITDIGSDARKMSKFMSEVSSTADSNRLAEFNTKYATLVSAQLHKLVENFSALGITKENKPELEFSWSSDFDSEVLDKCEFRGSKNAAVNALQKNDYVVLAARELAASAPWYPAGYSAFSEDIAYKWSVPKSDPCGGTPCLYWGLSVIAHSGCPGGVYGELNIMQNDVAVAWTNDNLSGLGAGQKGKLTFLTYELGNNTRGVSASLSQLSCNN